MKESEEIRYFQAFSDVLSKSGGDLREFISQIPKNNEVVISFYGVDAIQNFDTFRRIIGKSLCRSKKSETNM